jgi:S-formylglutathione hydrolase FrmB
MRGRSASLVGLAVAVFIIGLFFLSGAAADTNDSLQVMGFDPDRASLLIALMTTALTAAILALARAPTAHGVVAGLVAGILTFGQTAWRETHAALQARGLDGTFDLTGWLDSLLVFVIAFAVAGWMASMLAREVRRPVVASVAIIRERMRGRDRSRSGGRLPWAAAVLGTIALVAVSLPVFGDMVNFAPDAHMRRDVPGVAGTVDGSLSPSATPSDSGTAGVSPAPPSGSGPVATGGTAGSASPSVTLLPDLVPGPVPASLITPGVVSAARPWASAAPKGQGQVQSHTLPAPWKGGTSNSISIAVYLPPGYDRARSTGYPVVYALPRDVRYWESGMQLPSLLDALITRGAIPPTIVIFASDVGGPYPDSECADSADGREWFDRFMATDLVTWVDSTYRTIATRAARATLGFSYGGYCAAAILAHHPDVFASAMILSGYFVSGLHSGTTPTAWRPFGGDAALMTSVSPITVVPRLPAALRARLFYEIVADPENSVYGKQLAKFSAVLRESGVPMALFPTSLGHTWKAASEFVPTMLRLLAGRMVSLGVFGPSG